MPQVGDSFTVTLKSTHIGWGTHRYSDSRPLITGECYIPIAAHCACQYEIYNSNHTHIQDIWDHNIFNA